MEYTDFTFESLGDGIERAHALDDGYYLCFSGKAPFA